MRMGRKLAASILLLSVQLGVAGCSTSPASDEALIPPQRHFTSQAEQDTAVQEFYVYDPAQTTNKNIYKFNAKLDEYVFLPVVDAYKFVTPEFFRRGVSNFFANIGEVTNFTNALLQVKPVTASQTLARFVINSTAGLAGTSDVATDWGIARQPEDFGKTLGYWGVDSGAYVVLPALGPSNIRDTVGKIVDYATLYFIIPASVQDTVAYDVVAYGLQPIDLRYTNRFRYFSTGSPFEYELVRYVVTQTRNQEIENERTSAEFHF